MLGRPLDADARVDERVVLIDLTDRVTERSRLVVPVVPRRLERHRMMGRGNLDGLGDLLDAQLEVFRKIVESGFPAGLRRQLTPRLFHLACALLSGAGDMNGPTGIPEVALQFPENRRDGERLEGHA